MKLKNILISTTLVLGMILPTGRVLDIDDINSRKKKETSNEDYELESNLKEDKECLILVNRYNTLDEKYEPLDLEIPKIPFVMDSIKEEQQLREVASNAVEELFRKAKSEGIIFLATSAFRSYKTQNNIYLSRIEAKGKEYADKYVALPGKSEHQTGLSIDVTNERRNFTKRCKEAKWLVKNAHKFGFILRYPEGKEDITGINYEPWHIRYVGKNVAKNIQRNGITLEEYIKNKSYENVRREVN